MSVSVKVDDRRRSFQNFRCVVELGLGGSGKSARGYLVVDTGDLSGVRPLTGEPFEIEVNDATEFKGNILRVTDEWLTPTSYEATIEAVGFLPLLNAHLVTCELPASTLSWQINYILGKFCDGFTLGTIESDPVMSAQTIYYEPASEIFRDLAERTGQVFELDFEKQVHFYQAGSVAPIASFVAENEDRIGDLIVTEDWANAFTVLVLTGVTIRTPYAFEEKFLGDGYLQTLSLSWDLWSINDITVDVSKNSGRSWIEKACLLDPLDTVSVYEATGGETEDELIALQLQLEAQRQTNLLGVAGSVYISVANSTIRFPGADPLQEGELVRARYHVRRTDAVLISRNETAMAALAARDGTDGVREKRMDMPALQASDLTSAMAYADMLLARGAWPAISGSFGSYVEGWLPAQGFTVSSTVRGIQDTDVWVTKVTKRYPAVKDDDDFKIHHTVEFADNPYALPGRLDQIIHSINVTPLPPSPIPFTTSTTTTTSSTSTSMTSTTTTLEPDNWCENDYVGDFPDRGNFQTTVTRFIRIVACAPGHVTHGRVYVRARNIGTIRLGVYDDAGDGDTPNSLRGWGFREPGGVFAGYVNVKFGYRDFPVSVGDIMWLAVQLSVAGKTGHQLAKRSDTGARVYDKETTLYGYADGLPESADETVLDSDETYYGALWVDALPFTSTSTSTTTTSTSTTTTLLVGTSTSTTTSTTTTTTPPTTTTSTSTTMTTTSTTSTSTTFLPGAILLEYSTPNP